MTSRSTILPPPKSRLEQNTPAYESEPLVHPNGFREYDARWWFGYGASSREPEINLVGMQAVGWGIGTLLAEMGKPLSIVVGHDFRAYSLSIKQALTIGLMAAGCKVHDIGLALSPMAYFAQFALDVPAVAMVTASHNDNGWTGVKIGCELAVTFGPDEMARLREIVLAGKFVSRDGGSYRFVPDMMARYIADLTRRPPLTRKLKVVVACGNGTAGVFAPRVLEAVGCEVVPLDCQLDPEFPRYNPNPEDMAMLHAIAENVRETGADLGLGFDGDGDRCGVIDHAGREIFADKIGVLLARDLSTRFPEARFVVDVKSTCLYSSDPVLSGWGIQTEYWKTGHSYIKRRVRETGALAGFEKSGHFFFGAPVGRGYDDGLVAALAVIDMLDRNPDATLADLYGRLPVTFGSPTMSPHCPDEVKYTVIERIERRVRAMMATKAKMAGEAIVDLVTVNGVRIVTADGTWGLVRASSNKPELVVIVESPVTEDKMRRMFADLDAVIRENPEVGAYNQTI